MPIGLLLRIVPWTTVAYVVAAVAILVFAGVDVIGMLDAAIVSPVIGWVQQVVIDQFTFW